MALKRGVAFIAKKTQRIGFLNGVSVWQRFLLLDNLVSQYSFAVILTF